jgi:2-amino-4-hydroxy-6-hydroxymethyldihydropteridine diphosphokinase
VTTHRAYVGLGANLGDAVGTIERAIATLGELGRVLARSRLYRTQAWGKLDQPSFVNAVVLLETPLPPGALLNAFGSIEKRLGRTAGERWGPRVIDLDLLLYDDREIDEPGLRVPHPRLHERAFVLLPLAELDERFARLRDALGESELAGVVPLPRSAPAFCESVALMSDERLRPLVERIEALARFLTSTDAVSVHITRSDEEIEVGRRPERTTFQSQRSDGVAGETAPQRIDTIKADLVGIFHVGRPAPAEGDLFEGDRELGYIEALGIRTPVHSMGAGRIVAIATADGVAVEYGQPLFLVARS